MSTEKETKKSVLSIAKGFGQGIWTNKYDILAMLAWPAAFLVLGYFLDKINYGPIFIFVNIFYTLAVVSICVHAPWIFMSIAAPGTWGRFINKHWEAAWAVTASGADSIDVDGKTLSADGLKSQLKVVTVVYLVLVGVIALISTAVFLGTPVASPADTGMAPPIEYAEEFSSQ